MAAIHKTYMYIVLNRHNLKVEGQMIAFCLFKNSFFFPHRLLQWLVDEDTPQQIRTDAAIIMGSIAKGTVDNVNTLVEEGSVTVLFKGAFY